MLSPAEPVVCIILFSRIVVFKNLLPKVIAMTAIGIDAETVSPAFKARYTVEAPNMIPKIAPVMIDLIVSSAITVSAGTKGLNFGCCSAIQLILVDGR